MFPPSSSPTKFWGSDCSVAHAGALGAHLGAFSISDLGHCMPRLFWACSFSHGLSSPVLSAKACWERNVGEEEKLDLRWSYEKNRLDSRVQGPGLVKGGTYWARREKKDWWASWKNLASFWAPLHPVIRVGWWGSKEGGVSHGNGWCLLSLAQD